MRRIMHMFNNFRRDDRDNSNGRGSHMYGFFAEEREDNTPEVDADVTSGQAEIERLERILRQIEQERAARERDSRLLFYVYTKDIGCCKEAIETLGYDEYIDIVGREDNEGNGIKLLNDECKAIICKKEEYRNLIDIRKLHNLIEALKREKLEKLADILRRNIEEYYPYAWNNNDDNNNINKEKEHI